ncbi:MAG: spore germination protein, partial [Bacilli bacterium]|nr:spore germination protein [Bacilli bacterium]
VIIIPTFFIDFFHTPDDYYQKNINTTFIRILRFFAFFIAIFLPGYYISITTYNPTSIPTVLLLNLIEQHTNVPFPAFFEILIMILAFEILRESDIRIPNKVGSSVSILGGLILGDAAVSAGIISPIMIIVVAISSISALVFSYNSIVNLIRYYRYFVLFLSILFGIYGIFIGFAMLVINLSSISSFGYPYTYPFVPFVKQDINDSIIKVDSKKKKRNPLLARKNINR